MFGRAFVFDVTRPTRIRIHGNFRTGFFVEVEGVEQEWGPFPDPAWALMVAKRWDGVLCRAN